MSKTIRMLLLGLVGAFALSSTGTALAAYTSPSLRVTDDRSSVTIRYTVSGADDPTAKLTFYAPTAYTASLTAAAGTTLGTVTAQGTAADLGGALLPLTGTVQARAANGTFTSAPGGPATPLTAGATQCTGTPTHTAYWVLILQAAGSDARAAGLRRRTCRAACSGRFGERVRVRLDPGLPAAARSPDRDARPRDLRLQADAGRLQGQRRLHERRHRPAALAHAGDARTPRTPAARTPPARSRCSP